MKTKKKIVQLPEIPWRFKFPYSSEIVETYIRDIAARYLIETLTELHLLTSITTKWISFVKKNVFFFIFVRSRAW